MIVARPGRRVKRRGITGTDYVVAGDLARVRPVTIENLGRKSKAQVKDKPESRV